MSDNLEAWLLQGGIGVTLTAVLTLIGLVVNARLERRKMIQATAENKETNRREAKLVAVEASETAVGILRTVMETQQLQLLDLNKRVTDQGNQLDDLQSSHTVAIAHIADSEVWVQAEYPTRPKGYPDIPDLLLEAVHQIEPLLRPTSRERRDPPTDEEEDD